MEKRLFKGSSLIIFLTIIMIQLTGCSIDGLFSNKEFNKGKGTESNPFHVTTLNQLQAIDSPEFLGKHFIQKGDIDASASADFQNGSGFKHIGDVDTPFRGSYDGNGYVIRDLKLHIKRSQGTHTGLFGYIKDGRIENITVDNSAHLDKIQSAQESAFLEAGQQTEYIMSGNVDLSDERGIGGMVGFNDGGEVLNCTFIGTMSGFNPTAGLVGINTGLVENSHFEGSIGGLRSNAGLVGINTGKIIRSSAKVRIGSPSGAFGLVDTNYGEIYQSYADVELYGDNLDAGLVAKNVGGRIEESYAKGEIFSRRRAAGLVLTNDGKIINSYSHVNVEIKFQDNSVPFLAAGLVTENLENGFIENSYATGTITANDESAEIGAVAVKNDGILESVYWDMDSIGNEEAVLFGSPEDTFGLTTGQMTGPAADQNMPAFDWVNVWRTTTGYPALWWED